LETTPFGAWINALNPMVERPEAAKAH